MDVGCFMAFSVPVTAVASPLSRLDGLRPRAAKVVNKVDTGRESLAIARKQAGAALKRAIDIVGLTDSEAAVLLADMDKGQLSRWLKGDENIILARVYGTKLHGPFAIEQARDAQGCTIETIVTYRAVTS